MTYRQLQQSRSAANMSFSLSNKQVNEKTPCILANRALRRIITFTGLSFLTSPLLLSVCPARGPHTRGLLAFPPEKLFLCGLLSCRAVHTATHCCQPSMLGRTTHLRTLLSAIILQRFLSARLNYVRNHAAKAL